MSVNQPPNLPMRTILIEICPKCNTLHIYQIVNNMIVGAGAPKIICNAALNAKIPPPARNLENPNATPEDPFIRCDNEIEPRTGNTFVIRHWRFAERKEFYKLAGAFKQVVTPMSTEIIKSEINPDIMDWAILHGVVESPMPLTKKEDLENSSVDGAILEALYSAIMDYNTPPLAPSSVSRLRYTPTTRPSARMTS